VRVRLLIEREPLLRKMMWLSPPSIVIPLTGETAFNVIACVRKVVELVNKLRTGRSVRRVIVIPASPASNTISYGSLLLAPLIVLNASRSEPAPELAAVVTFTVTPRQSVG
jgi:hypothetical protein